MPDKTLLEGLLERAAAGETSRRGLLATVGRASVALSLGAAGGRFLSMSEASAHVPGPCGYCNSPCGCNNSVTCTYLTGVNSCPASTIDCGYWEYVDAACNAPGRRGYRRWTDCCGACNDGGNCACMPTGSVTCCNHRTYPSTVGCNAHIKCRRWGCV